MPIKYIGLIAAFIDTFDYFFLSKLASFFFAYMRIVIYQSTALLKVYGIDPGFFSEEMQSSVMSTISKAFTVFISKDFALLLSKRFSYISIS